MNNFYNATANTLVPKTPNEPPITVSLQTTQQPAPKAPAPFGEIPKTPYEPPVTVSLPTQAAAPDSPFIQIPNTNISIDRNVPNILNVLNIRKIERNEVKRAKRAQEIFERLLAGYTMPSNEDRVKIAQYAMEMAKKDKTVMPENQGVGGFMRTIFGGRPRGFAGE